MRNQRIRKVDTLGVISTVAVASWPEDAALDAVGADLDIADTGHQVIHAVHFAEYPQLALTNVSASDARPYAVVIANPYGSVTSAVATFNGLGGNLAILVSRPARKLRPAARRP